MKKLISFLVGLSAVLSIFLALYIPTDGFKDWSFYAEMFHKAGDKVNETFGEVEPQAETSVSASNTGLNKSATNGGVILDSEDTPITVSVQQVPSIGNYGYVDIDGSIHRYYSMQGSKIAESFDVYMELLEPNSAGYYTYSNKVLLYDSVPFTWRNSGVPGCYNSSEIIVRREDIESKYSELFETHYPLIRLTYICKAAGYLDSDPFCQTLYVGETPTLTWESDTVIKYTGVSAPTPENTGLDQGVLDNFLHIFSFSVGTRQPTGGTTVVVIDGESYTVGGTGNAACFTETVENGRPVVRCDLTRFKNADTVGEYYVQASVGSVDCSSAPGSTGGGNTWINATVWGHYLEATFNVSRLAAPANVRMENTSLKWDEVPGAQGYGVFDGDSASWTVSEPSFDIKGKGIANGEHTFRIRALGNVGSTLSKDVSNNSRRLTAFNASNNITPLVAVTFDVCGDTVSKLVPRGKNINEVLFDVEVDGKIFGGWYYDQGFTQPVGTDNKLENDVTVYARMVDKEVEEPTQSWWDKYMWWILGPAIGIGSLLILAIVVAVIRKRKS